MSLYKQTLHAVIVSRNDLVKQIAEALPTSERTAYRILKGQRKLTAAEALQIKVIINEALNKITVVAAKL